MNESRKLMIEALIDYIANTPNNFNANLCREFLINPDQLVENYLKKIEISTTDDSAIPSDSSDIPIFVPGGDH